MIGGTKVSIKYDCKTQFKFQIYKYIILINQFYIYLRVYTTVQCPIIKKACAHVHKSKTKPNQAKTPGR
jgi:hypothetical protein